MPITLSNAIQGYLQETCRALLNLEWRVFMPDRLNLHQPQVITFMILDRNKLLFESFCAKIKKLGGYSSVG
jgi:hypothetical protein